MSCIQVDIVQIGERTKVLCDSDGKIKIHDDMRPTTRHKDGFTWLLQYLHHAPFLSKSFSGCLSFLECWIYLIEPRDALVVIRLHWWIVQGFGRIRWKETPPLVTSDESVPG
jgi:hypothetical protein